MKTTFIFQETRIWEGSNDNPDPTRPKKKITAGDERRARKKLPTPDLGRKWVIISATPKKRTKEEQA